MVFGERRLRALPAMRAGAGRAPGFPVVGSALARAFAVGGFLSPAPRGICRYPCRRGPCAGPRWHGCAARTYRRCWSVAAPDSNSQGASMRPEHLGAGNSVTLGLLPPSMWPSPLPRARAGAADGSPARTAVGFYEALAAGTRCGRQSSSARTSLSSRRRAGRSPALAGHLTAEAKPSGTTWPCSAPGQRRQRSSRTSRCSTEARFSPWAPGEAVPLAASPGDRWRMRTYACSRESRCGSCGSKPPGCLVRNRITRAALPRKDSLNEHTAGGLPGISPSKERS
jgi:hypothetical protein